MPASSPLHQLASDHYGGRLGRADYLAARRRLLDAASGVGGKAATAVAPAAAVTASVGADDTRPHPITRALLRAPTPVSARRGRGLALALLGLVVVAGAGAWWLLGR